MHTEMVLNGDADKMREQSDSEKIKYQTAAVPLNKKSGDRHSNKQVHGPPDSEAIT